MSSRNGFVFVVITAGAWILVLFSLLHQRLSHQQPHDQIKDSEGLERWTTSNPVNLQTGTREIFDAVEVTRFEQSLGKAVIIEKVLSKSQSPTVVPGNSISDNKSGSDTNPITSVERRDHSPKSVDSYKHVMTWADFVSTPPQPLRPARNFTNPTNLRLCDVNVVNKLTQRLSRDEFDWCNWALSSSGGSVQVGHP
jgi:hypothetical protein